MGSRKSGTTEDRLTREAFDIEEVNQVRELGWGSDKEWLFGRQSELTQGKSQHTGEK